MSHTVGAVSEEHDQQAVTPLTEPEHGVPEVIADPDALADGVRTLEAGEGPIAVDTERASGYRYSQRAYLIQLRRTGTPTLLIDPVALDGELDGLVEALDGPEWVLHAASQDLPCLDELGMRPARLFDTELAARLAGYERVALGTMVRILLGYELEKGHSAADWSRRPLPKDWLVYAALDVELLIELRDRLEEQLRAAGKLEWALQEFDAVRTAPPRPQRQEPWRRTSGIHRVRSPRKLAAVRELWLAREQLAARRDIAPGRVLPDSAIVQAATEDPRDAGELIKLPVFRGRAQRRNASLWSGALQRARELDGASLPNSSPQHEGPPPTNRWAERDPDAAARLSAAREALNSIAERHTLPVENLLLPDLVRRLSWQPPGPVETETVAEALRAGGARPWQVELTGGVLTAALRETAPVQPGK